MRNIIIGTAGHIDHGKTSLIKGITGDNTDRLKEEQKRGISIDIGFSFLDLPSNIKAGIIDVPGHEKFVKNMLAGIYGVDLALLVIAADEGIMQQTKEHIEILELLEVEKSLIVLTKIDLVDDEWINLIEEEIKEELKNTIFEHSTIVKVSNNDKIGYDSLIDEIDKLALDINEKNLNINPILPIDRSFSIKGHGTVVTGTLVSGVIKVSDEIEIYPEEIISKVRSIQVHDKSVEECYAGQRVAINLSNIEKDDVKRGSVLTLPNNFNKTSIVSVKLKLLGSLDREIKTRTRVRVYVGTKEVLGRVIFLDKDEASPGETVNAQIFLEEEIVVKHYDRFIMRFYSPISNIGGGVIIDPYGIKEKRFDKKVISKLESLDTQNTEKLIYNIIKYNKNDFVPLEYINKYVNLNMDYLLNVLKNLDKKEMIITFILSKEYYYMEKNKFNTLKNKLLQELEEFHFKLPLKIGIQKEEIRNKYFSDLNIRLFEEFIKKIINEGLIKQEKEYISLSNHKISLSGEEEELGKLIMYNLEKEGLLLPKLSDLEEEVNVDSKQFYSVIKVLEISDKLVKLDEDYYISVEQLDLVKDKLKEYLIENTEISVGDFRDLLGVNRKISISILEYLDKTKFTKRRENSRILF